MAKIGDNWPKLVKIQSEIHVKTQNEIKAKNFQINLGFFAKLIRQKVFCSDFNLVVINCPAWVAYPATRVACGDP